MSTRPPGRELERELLAQTPLVAGMDEVGRGALAGPVSVGVAVVDVTTGRIPSGLRDSKLLAVPVRERLVRPIRRWAVACAVGHASPEEIDRVGIIAALRLAGSRALVRLAADGVEPGAIILDGSHDWLTTPAHLPPPERATPPVRTQVKADLRCAAVAAASVLAKVERDAMLVAAHAEYPDYGWAANKGYSAPEHLRALGRVGACDWHRRSWSLPTGPRPVAAPLPLELPDLAGDHPPGAPDPAESA
ncbi:ribonuclease HII [Ruania suaedae]|uniref:ribonuclease HII n=1 Tax=Ruania suaedae TaxID=2897774 RepID=UPI001E5745F8|nr:ribonuclease HII [Ruania suaedae]UFU04152.1 ribonuclease HII [Ruania suaedae]